MPSGTGSVIGSTTIPALLLSLVNLLAMEYFFVLELLRVGLHALALQDRYPGRRELAKRTALATAPYWILFVLVVLWRMLFFEYQNTNYEYSLLAAFKSAPLAALWGLISSIAADLWTATGRSWAQIATLPGAGSRLGADHALPRRAGGCHRGGGLCLPASFPPGGEPRTRADPPSATRCSSPGWVWLPC